MSTLGNVGPPTIEDATDNYRLALPITPTENGTITDLSAYCRNVTGSNTIVLSLHDDNGGEPGVKLADTGSLAEPTGGATALTTGSVSPTAVTNGVPYWIVIANTAAPANAIGHRVGRIASGTLYFYLGNGTPPDDTWGDIGDVGTDPGGAIVAYATYTPAGGAADAPPVVIHAKRPNHQVVMAM